MQLTVVFPILFDTYNVMTVGGQDPHS